MPFNASMPILVVDDFAPVVRIMSALLRQAGFVDVDGAFDGEEALARMKERRYGAVISDWHMEPGDGLQLLKEVRADAELKDIPFIMVSAEASPQKQAEAKAEGANDYVVKPFDAQTLRSRVEKACVAGEIATAAA